VDKRKRVTKYSDFGPIESYLGNGAGLNSAGEAFVSQSLSSGTGFRHS